MLDYTLTAVPQDDCFELVALNGDALPAVTQEWPSRPGAVRRSSERAELLHFAPGRWLVPEPAASLREELARIEGASLVDVEGQWHRMVLRGKDASRVLRAGVPVESMLEGRECAAATLFDCPVVIGRLEQGYEIWVAASYAESFRLAVESVAGRAAAG
jgi:heterotetrameric sarcosine oxidase gamma subunit